MGHAFQLCALDHPNECNEMRTVCDIHSATAISTATAEKQQAFKDQLDDFMRNVWEYVGHILRTELQSDYYRYRTSFVW